MYYGFLERIQTMAKMAGLHAEGLTDKDLEDLESAEILEEVLLD